MLNPLFDITHLKDHIAAGGLVLTANRRLARSVLAAWGQHCHSQGVQVWPQPPVYALDDWFTECWQQLLDVSYPPALAGAVVNPHGECWLWQQVIAADGDAPGGDPAAYAELARAAWHQLERWRVPPRQLEYSHHDGCRHLLRWLDGYRKALAQRSLISREQALGLVSVGFREGVLPAPTAIRLVGFQSLPPLYRDILAAAGVPVDEHTALPSNRAVAWAAIVDDDDSELLTAACWAKMQLDAAPDARIGVVVPHLTGIRARVERVFRDQLTPAHCLPGSGQSTAAFNISAGVLLARTPLVASALNLLALRAPTHPLPYYCGLLTDPFWGDADNELTARSRAEVLLRELGKAAPSTADFRQQVQSAMSSPSKSAWVGDTQDGLIASDGGMRLQHFNESLRRQPAKALLRDWGRLFSAQLQILGWPGGRTLDSTEYQQWQHWGDLLDEFAALSAVVGPVSSLQALAQLRQMAAATVFQPQTADAPVQVLGLLEAVGLRFDRLWVVGMDASRWPQPPAPNPLLPVALQRSYGMPRSSTEQELRLAQALFENLRNSADQVIFSHARRDGDGERLTSTLIRDLPPWSAPVVNTSVQQPVSQPLMSDLLGSAQLERVPIGPAPPLARAGAVFAGGSGVLRDQAGCPFNAFAIWRLGATPLKEPAFGLSALDRGTIIHRCLELLWSRLQTKAALLQLDVPACTALITEVIADALRPWQQDRSDLFGPRFVRIERARLHGLLSSWLDIDRGRDDFTVLAPEQAVTVDVAGLTLSLRIDRIDQLADGSLVLIDYKTGAIKPDVWAGERPEEPQLPLYALSQQAPVAALCLARVSGRAGVDLCGTGRDTRLMPGLVAPATIGLPDSWPASLAHWRQVLEQLAREFLDGHAELAFHTRSAADHQGHLLPLNRWPEWATLMSLEGSTR